MDGTSVDHDDPELLSGKHTLVQETFFNNTNIDSINEDNYEPVKKPETVEEVLIGMDPRTSLKIYPRLDNIFKSKSSFNYDMMRTKIFEERPKKNEELVLWTAHGLIGIFVGFIAFCMHVVEDELIIYKVETM